MYCIVAGSGAFAILAQVLSKGCVLSPFYSSLYWVIRKVNAGNKGMTERLEDVVFANDPALMAQKASDMVESLKRLVEERENKIF